MSDTTFYHDLPPFRQFAELMQPRHYHPVPEDWAIVITDVVDSTKAITAGRYKDVNTVGAASIVAVYNALETLEFPFVFGGDGATMLLPASWLKRAAASLLALAELSERKFGLRLRVGAVPVKEVREAGFDLAVARFALFRQASVAFLRGGGAAWADARIKADPERYHLPGEPQREANLQGLSCRWRAIPNRRGRVLSVLVLLADDAPEDSFDAVLQDLGEALGGDFDAANPVNVELMNYQTIGQCRREEGRLHRRFFSRAGLLRFCEIVAAVLIFRHGLRPGFFNPKDYRTSMRPHSDYRKFDDMLRLVIDCSPEQHDALAARLDARHRRGELYYGLHPSETALMTCFVDNVHDGGHVHFIDGGDGGYALAARQLKAQLMGAASD